MSLFGNSVSDYYHKWGTDIEQRERRQQRQDIQWIEHCLQTDFELSEAQRKKIEERFRQILVFVPEERLPKELDGFSASGDGLLAKAILYFSSLGLMGAKDTRLPAGEMASGVIVHRAKSLLPALCAAHPNLLRPGTKLSEAPFFREVGELSEARCGDFWRALIQTVAVRHEIEDEQYGSHHDEDEYDTLDYDIELGIEDLLYLRDVFAGADLERDLNDEVEALMNIFQRHVKRFLG